jgi:hypothetical protein
MDQQWLKIQIFIININISKFLLKSLNAYYFITIKGAVPVALLNLQKTPYRGVIPDAWHHQMIYKCTQDLIYLTNPHEFKTSDLIMNELCSESVLLVRSTDIVHRFSLNKYDLSDLISYDKLLPETERQKWIQMNVLGQVLSVLLEKNCIDKNDFNLECIKLEKAKEHVMIPASYKSGITLFARKDSDLFKLIEQENI